MANSVKLSSSRWYHWEVGSCHWWYRGRRRSFFGCVSGADSGSTRETQERAKCCPWSESGGVTTTRNDRNRATSEDVG